MQPHHFFIIGAQRSGTTYLYNLLDQLPSVCMAKPIKPEPKFFIAPPDDVTPETYRRRFHNNCRPGVIALGEKSTSYYEKPEVASNIYQCFPSAKIVFLMRNPVQRAISNYFFSFQHGLEDRSPEDVFLKRKPEPDFNISTSVSPFNYLGRGNYSKYLPAYISKFGRGNVHAVLFDSLISDTRLEMFELLSFLGVAKSEFKLPDFDDVDRNSSSMVEKKVSDEVVQELYNYYADEIEKLEHLINMDLSIWKLI